MAGKLNMEVARLKQKIKSKTVTDTNGCFLWFGGKDKNKKYGRIWANMYSDGLFTGKSVEVHRVAYLIWSDNFGATLADGLEVSHLCHEPICCNLQHLSLEPKQINQEREHCLNQNMCMGHASYPCCIIFS